MTSEAQANYHETVTFGKVDDLEKLLLVARSPGQVHHQLEYQQSESRLTSHCVVDLTVSKSVQMQGGKGCQKTSTCFSYSLVQVFLRTSWID